MGKETKLSKPFFRCSLKLNTNRKEMLESVRRDELVGQWVETNKLSEKDEVECVEIHRRMVRHKVCGDGVTAKCTVCILVVAAPTGDCK